ncbi:MAG: hypothetical protein IT538_04605 [Variibacter sp.]|nr:hypothetical protein [Variibacter sp.]
MAHARKSPVSDYRRRIKREGYVRLEVLVRKDDAELVRNLVQAMADPARRAIVKDTLVSLIQKRPRRDLKALLASAPLEGIDLTRERDFGREIDL